MKKLNLLVYNFPYSGKIVSGILKISSDNKTYISYSEGKNLYYKIAIDKHALAILYCNVSALIFVILTILIIIRKFMSGERIIITGDGKPATIKYI